MHQTYENRRGMSLLEIILAMVVLTAVAAATLAYVRQPADRVKRQACSLRIQQLEVLSRQYQADTGRLPSRSMTELSDQRYLGEAVARCPYDGRAYQLDTRTGLVITHDHPSE